MQASVTVDIDAPPERVWAVLTDVEAWPEWTASITSVRRLDKGPLHEGSRVLIRQPRIPPTLWTVTELEDGESFVWTAPGPGLHTRASHTVTPAGSGSRAVLAVDPGGVLGRAFGRLYGSLTERYLDMEAAGLKQRAEQPPQGTAG